MWGVIRKFKVSFISKGKWWIWNLSLQFNHYLSLGLRKIPMHVCAHTNRISEQENTIKGHITQFSQVRWSKFQMKEWFTKGSTANTSQSQNIAPRSLLWSNKLHSVTALLIPKEEGSLRMLKWPFFKLISELKGEF